MVSNVGVMDNKSLRKLQKISKNIHEHYYILCLFAKGQTKNLKGLRSKNKKPEGFAKQKQSAIFAM